MFNLLPKTKKDGLRREYRTRLILTFLVLFFFTEVVSIALLSPSYLLSRANRRAATEELAVLKRELRENETDVLTEELRRMKIKIDFLGAETSTTTATDLLVKTLNERPAGFSVGSVYAKNEGGGVWVLELTGTAKDRETLRNFQQRLRGMGAFASVEVPISSFAKEMNLDAVVRARSKP
jgi:hypothetical protein